jgi:hypothetical protein
VKNRSNSYQLRQPTRVIMVKDMVHFVQAESVEPSRPEEKILE